MDTDRSQLTQEKVNSGEVNSVAADGGDRRRFNHESGTVSRSYDSLRSMAEYLFTTLKGSISIGQPDHLEVFSGRELIYTNSFDLNNLTGSSWCVQWKRAHLHKQFQS